MRRALSGFIGFAFGFAIVISTVAAAAFAVIGVGGHLLARADYDYARVISFDPSTVASRAPLPGLVAVLLSASFVALARRMKPPRR